MTLNTHSAIVTWLPFVWPKSLFALSCCPSHATLTTVSANHGARVRSLNHPRSLTTRRTAASDSRRVIILALHRSKLRLGAPVLQYISGKKACVI